MLICCNNNCLCFVTFFSGLEDMKNNIALHFHIPANGSQVQNFENFVYLSQVRDISKGLHMHFYVNHHLFSFTHNYIF